MNKIGVVQGEQVDGLKRTIEKVKLDKQILLKEKLEAIWRDQSYEKTGPFDIKSDLREMKQERQLTNLIQREGYQQMLVYIKERDGHPLAEEKQLLDCLKLVLDNGWTVRIQELIKLFDMLELQKKVSVTEEFTAFIEFCMLLAMMLKVDSDSVEAYFSHC